MKRIALLLASSAILATPALAADAIMPAPPAPQPLPMEPIAQTKTWTGIYIGGQAGVSFGNDADDISFDPDDDGVFGDGSFDGDNDENAGFVGGAHIGYDYQFQNNVVLGAVADINYIDAETNRSYTVTDVAGNSGSFDVNSEINYLGTVRARLGYDFNGVMPYATGGLAYAGYDRDTASPGPDVFGENVSYETDGDDADIGYSVGGGVDVLATENISFGVEYLYTNLGSNDYSVTATSDSGDYDFTTESNDEDLDFHTIWAKASYRFN